ncbi:hypothetical protein [Cellulosimicrobium cellulans]|uniref:hypothetical protein n=1 Tax=Cellulosimicrobium cellulans TaxID=1710 RepID=UPI001BAD685C|nr:hypothetical protein [Cellulosimicrobium cellulans]QUC00620.1 hypothetical protein J5A69_05145 [Cellulosimicrobium cellulans]
MSYEWHARVPIDSDAGAAASVRALIAKLEPEAAEQVVAFGPAARVGDLLLIVLDEAFRNTDPITLVARVADLRTGDAAVVMVAADDEGTEAAESRGWEAMELMERAGFHLSVLRPFVVHRTLEDDMLRDLATYVRRAAFPGRTELADPILEAVREEMVANQVEALPGIEAALRLPDAPPGVGPAFQFERGRDQVYSAVADLAGDLAHAEDPLGAYSWWTRKNSWINAVPADLLGTDGEALIAYAAERIHGDDW